MTRQAEHELVKRICNGNQAAEQWVQILNDYDHLSDDIVDNDRGESYSRGQAQCRLGVLALQLYTHPFFLRYSHALCAAMLKNIGDYQLSLHWRGAEGWQGICADWLRHGQIAVLQVVAAICGSYESMVAASPDLWTLAYESHHDKEGNPV